jgi:site-specific DNA-cytosine methylase
MIQGFPFTYLLDPNSRRANLQVGNAIPPPVMRDIIKFVLNDISKKNRCAVTKLSSGP